jgi:hypothetical protein
MTIMQVNIPTLTPAPSGKYTGLPDYIAHAIHQVGSAKSLAKLVGLTTGSRVSDWRAGYGVPGVLMALRLARITGDDPFDVLTMAGHKEEVEELRKVVTGATGPSASSQLHAIEAAEKMEMAIRLIQKASEALHK